MSETEIEIDEDGTATEDAAKAFEADGNREKALELRLQKAERALARERGKSQKVALDAYKTTLATEYEYADPDLITGKNREEMKASAERAHNAVAKVIEAKGLKAAPAPTPEAAKAANRTGDWGAPPAAATEVITGETPLDWSELQNAAYLGKTPDGKPMSRAQVLSDMRKNGTRTITRPTIAGVAMKNRDSA